VPLGPGKPAARESCYGDRRPDDVARTCLRRHLAALVECLGISTDLQSKTIRPEMDIVGDLVARGDAELGVTAISTLLATPGVDVVGPLPREIQSYVYFEAGIGTSAVAPEAARDLIKFLTKPSAGLVIQSKGTELW